MIYKKEDLKRYRAADAIGYESRTSGLLRRLRNDLGVTVSVRNLGHTKFGG